MSSSNDHPSKHKTSTRSTKNTWRPSAQDHSSRAWTGSFTARDAARRPAEVTRRPLNLPPILGLGLMLLVAGIGVWLASDYLTGDSALSSSRATDAVAVVELVRGPVQLVLTEPDNTLRRIKARPGLELPAGAVVELDSAGGDEGNGMAVRLGGGSSARFAAGSRATLSSRDRIDLERGAVYVDSRQGIGVEAIAGDPVEVRTTFGMVRDIGTQFEVRLETDAGDEPVSTTDRPVLRVRVREGRVVYTAPTGSEHQAAVGEELRVLASGGVERAPAAIYGPRWQWVIDNAAVPEVEGRSLSIYLQWLEREGGWALRYEDQSRAFADDTKLFGNIHGLSAKQATPMVFAGSGLVYGIEDGELVISKRRP